jgi:glutamine amidotransferase-like uncharacterized protein
VTAAILVYQDYVHNQQILFNALARHFGGDEVAWCDADAILNWGLNSDVKLFVMPGGADLYYCEKLNGAGNAHIRAWVEAGGTWLGFCAGAYYACNSIEWAKDTGQPICGPRELGFFAGTARGPVTAFIENGDVAKSWLAAPVLRWDDGNTVLDAHVCYEGGPLFDEGNATVLARYAGLEGAPPAIIETKAGQGRAILSSPHPERLGGDLRKALYRHRNSSYEWEKAAIETLDEHDDSAVELQRLLFSRALNGE